MTKQFEIFEKPYSPQLDNIESVNMRTNTKFEVFKIRSHGMS